MTFRRLIPAVLAVLVLLSAEVAFSQTPPPYLLGRVDPGGQANNLFGIEVELVGTTAAVGGAGRDRVTLYRRDLEGPDAWGIVTHLDRGVANNDLFGRALDFDGDRVAVGAPFSNEVLFEAGGVWIYERNAGGADNWGEVKEISPTDLVPFDHFGGDLALDGDRLLVGSPDDNYDNLNDPGSAYLFERDAGGVGNWGEVAQLVPSGAAAHRHCGGTVALDGDVAALLCYGSETVYVLSLIHI